jgi:hypothetical protein
MIEPKIRAIFNEIAQGEAGPSRVDAQLAVRRGRARLRWRRARLAGGPVLAVGVAAALALAVAAGPFRADSNPAAGGGPAAPLELNPLVPYVSFGWLPHGVTPTQGHTYPTEVFMTAGSSAIPGWEISAYARGQCRVTGQPRVLACSSPNALPGLKVRFTRPAPDVDGHRAFWANTTLVWQYARGGWAALGSFVRGVRYDQARRNDAVKIARTARFGAATPLLFPVRLTGLPSQSRVNDVLFWANSGKLLADQFVLANGASRFVHHAGDTGIWVNAPYIYVHPAPAGSTCVPHDPASQNTPEHINGYQMVLKLMRIASEPNQELCGAHAGGYWADFQEFGPHPAMDVVTLFRDHVHLLGTDPAGWITNPLG